MEDVFQNLLNTIQAQQALIAQIANHLDQITSIGGGGSASIEDYESGKLYKRNMLIVDPQTETVYRVLREYTSVSINDDLALVPAALKLVGVESQVVTFPHNPSQAEIDNLNNDVLVAVYSSTDAPYVPDN
jgi:hypothetical protein